MPESANDLAARCRGTCQALRLLVRNLETLTSAQFEVDLEDVAGTVLYSSSSRIRLPAALTNAVRHSGATVILAIGCERSCLRLGSATNGRGFHPLSVDRNAHFGLQLMRERIELVGGLLYVDAAEAHGTTVVARLPIEIPES
jgi:signal transduction histidine kinase